ncbi:ANTAR domain-containing protein [Streptomyces sp. NPDC050534]|uniref:ANTAR domain-containing protein n=1 Tax=Streptomyces sp. NPDC050534 TaxID=3365625 RepID=UPI0037AA876C
MADVPLDDVEASSPAPLPSFPADTDSSVVEERNKRLARESVARAEGLLMSRYGLGSPKEAFGLLRRASQQFNIKLHTLADVAVHLPPPDIGAARWVPPRPRVPAPPLPDLGTRRSRVVGQSGVLKAAMHRVMQVTQTTMANVQLAENGFLRLEQHFGLGPQFTEYFAFVEMGGKATSCSHAADQIRQVTVHDIAVSDLFNDTARAVILGAGSRACHSVPLVGLHGAVMGVVSSHHASVIGEFDAEVLFALQALGTQVGAWLSWYRNAVVLDALESIHAAVSAKGDTDAE